MAGCGSDSGSPGGSGGSPANNPGTGGSGSRSDASTPGSTGGSSGGASGGASGGSSGQVSGGGSSGSAGNGGTAGGGGRGGSGGAGTGAGGSAPDGGGGSPPAAGPLTVVEFTIPRAGNFPHDPAVDGKGRGWWVDSDNSFVGYWDPVSKMTKDFPSGTPGCYLHGLNPDDQDNIWYTGKGCNKIGKLDPATGMVTEYPVMGDPHTLVWSKGIIWFTVQNGDRYGRLDPATGMSQVWPAGAGSGPYGIWPAPDGTLWMALFGGNGHKIAQIDPANPAMLKVVPLPNASSNARRLAVDSVGHVYYGDYARGYLGRYDPSPSTADNARWKEWLSPGGAGARPYGITVGPDKRIYYFQGMNSIAVFNPADEKFETVRIPTGGSVVRNMATDFKNRRVWLGLSGVGKIAYIDVP